MQIKQSNKGIDTTGYIVKKNIHVGILGKKKEDGRSQFIYTLWKIVKSKLEKMGFKIKETIIEEPNYDKEIENLSRNKYDILVGYISILSRRSTLANYTRPLILDQQVIVFKPETEVTSYFYHLLKLIQPVIVIFLTFGFLLSTALYLFGNHFAEKKKNKIGWHFWGTFGAILGETGTIVEQIDITKTVNIFIAFLILLFVFFFSLILEASLTQQTYQKSIEADEDPIGVDIKNDKFLVGEGTSMVDTIKRAGGIAEKKNIKTQEIQDIYLKNTNKNIKGFVTDLSTWGGIIHKKKKYSNLVKSDFQFPFDDIAWMVNRNEHVLLESVQRILLNLRSENITKKLCLEKMPWMDLVNCSI